MSNDFTMDDFNSMIGAMEEEKNAGGYVSPYWKPKADGTYKLRILTPMSQFGEKLFYQKHKMHYVNNRAYFCLHQTLTDKNGNVHESESCPICAKSSQLYNSSVKGTKEWDLAGQLRAKDRYVSRVIVRGKTDKDGNNTESTPEFWEFGQKIHDYFFNTIKMGEYGNFLSLRDGRDYNLVKKGTGRNTNYDGSGLSIKQSMIFENKEDLVTLMEKLKDMSYSKLVEFASKEELENAIKEQLSNKEESSNDTVVINDSLDPFSQPADSVNPVANNSSEKEESIDDLLNMMMG